MYPATRGRTQESLAHGRQAVAMFEALVKDFPDVTDYREALLTCQANLYILLSDCRLSEEAEQVGRRRIDLGESSFRSTRPIPSTVTDLSMLCLSRPTYYSVSPPGEPLHEPAQAVELARRAVG